MKYVYRDHVRFDLPFGWTAEENSEGVSFYHPFGQGAVTVSFFTAKDESTPLSTHLQRLIDSFATQNHITLASPLTEGNTKNDALFLEGVGQAEDGWFVKLWAVAQGTHILFASYFSKKETREIKKADSAVKSARFI